ncbi:hypothetical protein REPUB_Repub07fG0102800 [Reevesia pubescens]
MPLPSCQLPCSVPQECIGGHVVLRNIPCGSKDMRCNKLCSSRTSCGQTYYAPQTNCRHTCTATCHPSAPCLDVSGLNADTVFEASIIQKLTVPIQPVELTDKNISLEQRKLMCDDECAKLECKRVLADAFDITPPNLDALHFVHVTPKSKPPPCIIGVKGSISIGAPHTLVFDPLVDMDPRLVVSFLNLPREADISALVLRFGGECELVWLNDKNALAVFSDPARAPTAMKRLDHGSVYNGDVIFIQSGRAL